MKILFMVRSRRSCILIATMTRPEIDRPSHTFSEKPLTAEQLLPTSASQQLYNTYTQRIKDFPGFVQLPFHEANDNFERTIIEADDAADIEYARVLLQQLVDPTAYDSLKNNLQNYWRHHRLEGDLQTYSYCFLTNHRFFSDLPILAGVMRDIRIDDPYAASRNIMVVGKMIPGMGVDIFGDDQPIAVTPLLSNVARQLQTVPKLPDDANEAMKAQRRVWNEEAKEAMKEAATTPGNILFIAASGSHDEVSDDKKSLTMQSINPETAELLCSERLKVIPLFFSCDSFSGKGLVPAKPEYRLLPPQTFQQKEEVPELMQRIAAIGSELLADEFPRGVHYEERRMNQIRKIGRRIIHS